MVPPMTPEPATQPTASEIRCAVAASTAEQIDAAIREAGAAAPRRLGGDADVAVACVTARYGAAIRAAMEGLSDVLAAPAVIATTAEAVLAADAEYESGPAVAVWLARLPGAVVAPFAIEYTQTPDGGMFVGWPSELDVGGMASGGYQPGSNTLVVGSRSYDSGAVGFLIGGAARIRPVVSQGCRPIGRPMVITKSEENVIVELGGRPALERLREIYGELDPADRELVRSSLHVGRVASEYQDHFQRGDFLVRNVVGADPDSGVIAVGDLVRTGQTIQFHVRDARSAHDDLAALLAREKDRGAMPAGALVFSCNGRGTRLFPEPSHDARCLQDTIGPVPAAGFFAQGEIGPIGSRNCLHGFTASIALVEPSPKPPL